MAKQKINGDQIGTTGGVWLAYTPTWTGISGGTTSAKYMQIGKTIFFSILYICAAEDISGQTRVTLPTAIASGSTVIGNVKLTNAGVGSTAGVAEYYNSTTIRIFACNAGSTYVSYSDLTASVPFTWGVSDSISITGAYEAA